ncbi:MAG: tetratricopeptide repeat protein [Campylobacterales bacterium]|nr:tetratricopeptide repeat protein [Campylobacterales bacterium]
MTLFQLLMLGASAFFAFKIYEHIQTLKDLEQNVNDNQENEPRSAQAFSPFSPEALVQKADIAYEEKDFDRAVALLTEANAKESNNPDIIFKLGYMLQQTGNDEEAMKQYKEALELDNENEYIHNSLASIYRKNGEFVSAKMHLITSLEINNENPITYYNYGNLLVDMQKKDEASAMYKKAVELNPEFSEAKQELQKLQEN